MVEKVKMVIEVDLQCCRCKEKIKKVLCKFPGEIQDTIYDEKNNKVTITVVCCNPEKLKQKICCKGGKSIKCIKIIKPQPDSKPKPDSKPPTDSKPQPQPQPDSKPKPDSKPPTDSKPQPQPDPMPKPKPTPPLLLIGVCWQGCCEGCGCRKLAPGPRPIPDGWCGCGCHRPAPGPVLDGWCGCRCRRGYYPRPCDYFCEENPSACTIM